MGAEAGAPHDGHRGEEGATDGPAGSEEGIERGERAESIRPRDVDNAVVVDPAGDEIEQGERAAKSAEGGEDERQRTHGTG